MSPEFLAWSAAIWEGEGSLWRNPVTYCYGDVRTTVAQKDLEILNRLKMIWGGKLNPPVGDRNTWQWVLNGEKSRRFLTAIYPRLSAHRQTQVNLAMAARLNNGPYQERIKKHSTRNLAECENAAREFGII